MGEPPLVLPTWARRRLIVMYFAGLALFVACVGNAFALLYGWTTTTLPLSLVAGAVTVTAAAVTLNTFWLLLKAPSIRKLFAEIVEEEAHLRSVNGDADGSPS